MSTVLTQMELLDAWRVFCQTHGRQAARFAEIRRELEGSRGGGLLPTIDWLGGVSLFTNAKSQALWAATETGAAILWCVYRSHHVVVRRPDRVIVGVENFPQPVYWGLAASCSDVQSVLDVVDESATWAHLWCRSWSPHERAEDELALLEQVGKSLVVPPSVSVEWRDRWRAV